MQKFKPKKYIAIFIALAGSIISFTSCLKENTPPPLYGYSTPNLVSFQDNGGASGGGAGYGTTTTPFPLYNFSFKLQNDTAGFDAIVIYGPSGQAPQDITLNIAVSQSVLDSFNNANSTGYVAPDNSIYSFPSSVVIHKGQSQAYAHVTITASSSYDFNASYALPLTITSSSYGAISSNFGSEINSFLVKNDWDGSYGIHVSISGNNSYSGTVFDDAETLATSGGSSVSEGDIADFFGGYTNYVFNTDGTITVFAGSGTNTGSYGAVVNQSSYDESNHTFHVNYSILSGKYVFDLTYTKQ